jgi:hypothetical protein
MNILPLTDRLASAHVVFNGRHGDVSRLARQRGSSRQALYRQAHAVARTLDSRALPQRSARLGRLGLRLRRRLRRLRRRPRVVVCTRERLARFACTAQAEGVSLPAAHRLLTVFLNEHAPGVARLGRLTRQAGERAGRLLEVLDEHTGPLLRQAATDEIFVGRKPVLMAVEPESLCWQVGRLSERRDGTTWAAELGRLPALEQVTRDAGTGLAKGVELVNAARRRSGLSPVADQADHFHLLREGTWALRRLQGRVSRALEAAEQADKELARVSRRGRKRTGPAATAALRWRQAEAAYDHWSAAEGAWRRVREEALPLFTPTGELNTRQLGQAVVAEVLPALSGPEWAKARRQLARPEVFTFLDRTQEKLASVTGEPGVKEVLVQAEGLRRRPERTRGESPSAAVCRGLLLTAAVLLGVGGEAVCRTAEAVQRALASAWRASSLVEGINSVLRMQQARHRRLTQGLLDLKRLYWNGRRFRTGRRRGRTPYQLVGLSLPTGDWWDLLQQTPEQLRQQLSASKQAV